MKKLIAFIKDEEGLETVEYAVMGSLIVLGLASIVALLGTAVGNVFTSLTGEITP